jgi:hypothetical protein
MLVPYHGLPLCISVPVITRPRGRALVLTDVGGAAFYRNWILTEQLPGIRPGQEGGNRWGAGVIRAYLVMKGGLPVDIYALVLAAPCLVGVAVVIAVIRADKRDLPDIVRALMRMGPRDDDSGKTPPSLPKP